MAWSPDGRQLAIARSQVIDLVDPALCMKAGSLEHLSDWARVSARSPSRTTAASVPVEGSFGGHTGFVAGLAWSPNGQALASAGADYTGRIWDLAVAESSTPSRAADRPSSSNAVEGRSLRDLLLEDPERVAQLISGRAATALSPDGGRVATAGAVTELGTGRIAAGLWLESPPVTALAWSPDGRLAIGREDGRLSLQLPKQNAEEQVIREGWTPAKAEEHASRKFSSGFIDLTSNITVGGYRLRLFDPDFSPVHALAWSPDGRCLAVAGLKSGLSARRGDRCRHPIRDRTDPLVDAQPGVVARRLLSRLRRRIRKQVHREPMPGPSLEPHWRGATQHFRRPGAVERARLGSRRIPPGLCRRRRSRSRLEFGRQPKPPPRAQSVSSDPPRLRP